jgi:hypothetical protein
VEKFRFVFGGGRRLFFHGIFNRNFWLFPPIIHRSFLFEILELSETFPQYDRGAVGHVERVFGAVLRYFKSIVAEVHGLLFHTFHFITDHKGVFLVFLSFPTVKGSAFGSLFHGQEGVIGRF